MWLGSFFMLTKRVRRDRSFDKHRTRRIGQFSCTGTPSNLFLAIRALQHCLFALFSGLAIENSALTPPCCIS